ncbi:hypothetical protein THAOC_29172 [Thalassiosira oceanica]|uniref:Uncharacterized protein n=1 Tax=Thalassiosira oceanica TaxID=159749 RepID=K0RD67_THAOC|nr:hypothetical protein THAOC_29172 [Thalassiosira oceanica]|eukprot:EJK51638.1 hypothetical protein THAOC_29172 [Thalassiosira oceanica]
MTARPRPFSESRRRRGLRRGRRCGAAGPVANPVPGGVSRPRHCLRTRQFREEVGAEGRQPVGLWTTAMPTFSTGRHWRHGTREQVGRMPGVGGLVTLASWESGGWRRSRAFPAEAGSGEGGDFVLRFERFPVIGRESIPRGDRPNQAVAKSAANPVAGVGSDGLGNITIFGAGRQGGGWCGRQPAGQRTSLMPSPSGSSRHF